MHTLQNFTNFSKKLAGGQGRPVDPPTSLGLPLRASRPPPINYPAAGIVKLMAEMDMVLSIEQFFEALDLDGQGSVTIDEFVQGVLRYQATPTNLDVSI